jgi:hypothetical protein
MPSSFTRIGGAVLACAALSTACSTAPRPYAPVVQVAPTAQQVYETDLADCNAQVAAGKRKDFTGGRTGSVLAGTAIGVGVGAATASSAAAGAGMLGGAAAGAGLATGFVLAAPIAIVVVSKSVRAHKEREIQTATATCLSERGYAVTDWTRLPKTRKQAAN